MLMVCICCQLSKRVTLAWLILIPASTVDDADLNASLQRIYEHIEILELLAQGAAGK